MLMSQAYLSSFDASMTSNDFAANLYDIEVTFVTEAYGIGSTVMQAY